MPDFNGFSKELPKINQSLFKINRDVRFSKDKSLDNEIGFCLSVCDAIIKS